MYDRPLALETEEFQRLNPLYPCALFLIVLQPAVLLGTEDSIGRL